MAHTHYTHLRSFLFVALFIAAFLIAVPFVRMATAKRAPSEAINNVEEQIITETTARILNESVPGQASRRVQVLIELSEPPIEQAYRFAAAGANAQALAQEQARKIEVEQNRIAAAIAGPLYSATELYRVQKTMNAIAAGVDADKLSDLRKLPGVKAVKLLAVETTNAAPASKGVAPQAQQIKANDPPGEVTVQVPGGRAGNANVQVLVELNDAPAARVYAETLRSATGSNTQIRAAAATAARNQVTLIRSTQQKVGADLAARVAAKEIYRVQKAFNGIAVFVAPNQVAAIRNLPGVRDVHPIEMEFLTNSTSVPFLGTPNVWGNTLGLPSGYTGAGMKIGIIDTGIDYQHANFGGTGVLADYQANNRTVITETGNAAFPTAKVVGGYDFAGDAYTGANAPAPDPDPMDCNGHGSHVAGSAAGFGVNADGTPFAGPFNTSVPFASLRIGPGVAPQASLYALRVFGCTGGTSLTVQAIDWAIDPNGDLDFSDRLDVINMSLGSNYGTLSTTTAAAADNAALAGVFVVASAGNAGDTFFITGSPGSSQRGISVAASGDNGVAGVKLTVNSPTAIVGDYPASATNSFAPTPAPDPSGQTAGIVLVDDGSTAGSGTVNDGCQTPFVNAAAVVGNFALIDRGGCGFQVKANNAQANGAIGVIIVNNIVGEPANFTSMGATGTTQVNIPVILVSNATGAAIKAQLAGGVNATMAAATQADAIASFSSRGPRLGKPNALKPDVAAPGINITSSQTGVTCTSGNCQRPDASGYVAGSQTLTLSGTSMAAPHVAGMMALLRQQRPTWTVEELKSLAMNTALNNVTLGAGGSGPRIGPSRIGAGRVDPQKAATANVVAFNAEDTGSVSLSFAGEIAGVQTSQKSLRLVNKGTTSVTYDLSIETVVNAPGVAFSLPGGSTVTVPAGESVVIPVQMDADASQMDHTIEASMATVQTAPGSLAGLGNLARHWLTEEGAYLNLSVSASVKLRVPVYASVRPASMMSAPATIATGGAASGSATISLTGQDVCTGTLGAGPTCTGSFPTDEVSLVTPFEWQVSSPRNNNLPDYADIKSAGVAFDATNNLIMFGVAGHGDWASPTQVAYNIYVDFNEDGTWDRILFNSNPGTMASSLFGNIASGQDSFINAIFSTSTNGVAVAGAGLFTNRASAAAADSALFNTNVMFLTATPAQLGLPSGDTTFRYKVVTRFGSNPLFSTQLDEAAGPYFWNYAAQGLNFGGGNLFFDLNGATLPVTWNTANMTTNGSLGALLLHHHNVQGRRDEVVVLQGTPTADLAVSKSVSNLTPAFGTNVTFTITVTNNGPDNATGVVVSDLLPAGLVHVSNNGGGAYDPVTGLWTVGNLANGAMAGLQITVTANTTDRVDNTVALSTSSPADPNPANNQATVSLMAPRSADLALQMSVSSPTVTAGNSVTYTMTVTNNGGDPAYSLSIPENFPAFPGLTASSFTASQGVFNPATGFWNLASLGKGGTATLSYTVTAPNTAGALTSSATASSNINDPNTGNNTASATTTVVSPSDINGTKTVAGTFMTGSAVTYTIVLSNSSTSAQLDNPGNEFTDVLPAGLTLVSANASSGTANANVGTNTVTWNGSIAGGGSVTITINATVNAAPGQVVSNQGTINYDADGNGSNESSRLTDDPAVGGASDPTSFSATCPTLTLNPVNLPNAALGGAYPPTFSISPALGTPTFTVTNGALPTGLTLNPNGTFSGTATNAGTFTFRVTATAGTCTGFRDYTVTVTCPTIAVSPAGLPNATVNTTYAQSITATPALAYTFNVTSGLLPAGLTLNSNGSFSGAPTQSGTFNFRVTAALGSCSTFVDYTLLVVCPAVAVAPSSLPNGTVGAAYSQSVSATLAGTYSFVVTSGALPTGLTLNAATGAITGTPTTGGSFTFTITASSGGGSGGAGACSGSTTYTVTIGCAGISFTTTSLPNGQAGVNYSQTPAVSPAGSYTFAIMTGNLPTGLTLNPATGAISGLPTVTGTSNFTIKAQTANGCLTTQAYTLVITCPTVTLAPSSLPNGSQGTAYSQLLTASPAGGNYTYAVTAGALPAGLNLNSATGLLSGTPTTNNTFTFTVTATGFGGCTGSQAYTITIGSGSCPTITLPAGLPNGSVGALYTNSVAATPAGGYAYLLTAGALPPGVSLFTNVGLIFGYPTAVGNYTFTVQATLGSCSVSRDYTVQISAAFASSLAVFSDFDGDLKSDLSLFRADGNWLVSPSGSAQTQSTLWGAPYAPYYDLTVSGDYDGDGKTDLAVFRRGTESAGYWFIKRSSDNGVSMHFWGLPTDIPVPGDYDGDGKTDVAVWRPSDGIWYIIRSSDLRVTAIYWGTGALDDLPVPGDYDGDGKTDAAIFRRGGLAAGYWYIKRSSDGGSSSTRWGLGKDLAAPGDYDGDNKTDLAVWRASEGKWYILESGSSLLKTIVLGNANDVLVPADYDGDGKADPGTWQAATGRWQFIRSSDGVTVSRILGQSGDAPVPLRRN